MAPPPEHQPIEARYIRQLMDVYRERWGQSMSSLEQVVAHAVAREHLRRQREAFYSAEALRLFARDRTPEGHFQAVLDDINDIVVEVAAATHASGWDRLQAALQAAGSIVLTQTVLSPFVRSKDRVGACHHLANADRLIWCPEGES